MKRSGRFFSSLTTMNIIEKKKYLFLPGMLCDPATLWHAQKQDSFYQNNYTESFFMSFDNEKNTNEMFNKINEITGKFSMIGFSMGGYLAQEYMIKYPQKVNALILINSSASGYTSFEKEQRKKLITKVKEEGVHFLFGDRLKNWINSNHKNKDQLFKIIEKMALEMGPDVFIQQQQSTLNRVDQHEALGKVTCPTLVIGCKQDKIVSSEKVEKLAKAIPHAELHLFEDSGHMLPLEAPEELNTFLKQWLLNEKICCPSTDSNLYSQQRVFK
jgi:alpha-beta hydrolase superfamily lysophospholipase